MDRVPGSDEAKRAGMMPPTYLLISLVAMVALDLLVPVARVVPAPYSYLGGLPLLVGLAVSVWASSFFNKVKTTIKPFERPSRLVTEGAFRFSRHPMYLGMALVLAGLALLLGTVTPVIVVPLFVWLMDRKFVAVEEKALTEAFGDAYAEYSRRVSWRWPARLILGVRQVTDTRSSVSVL